MTLWHGAAQQACDATALRAHQLGMKADAIALRGILKQQLNGHIHHGIGRRLRQRADGRRKRGIPLQPGQQRIPRGQQLFRIHQHIYVSHRAERRVRPDVAGEPRKAME